MRKILMILAVFLYLSPAYSQIPAGYYDATYGLSGEPLRNALHDIISNGFTSVSYSNLWTTYYQTDAKPNGKVWDMYSDIPGGTAPYEYTFGSDQCGTYNSEGDCYNREHSVPASWFNDNSPMYSDVFMVIPTDGWVNNKRGNDPFGEVGSASWTSQNGSKTGSCNYPGYSGNVFEPIDSFKGDFARIYFYVAVRYKDEIPSWSGASFSGGNLSSWTENMMLEWHALDPVSDKERDRNNAVYNAQHNRNPFVDMPHWVYYIWSPTAGMDVAEIQPSLKTYPVPAKDKLNIEYNRDLILKEIRMYNVFGSLVCIFHDEKNIDLSAFSNGVYSFSFVFDKAVEIRLITIQH
ncbi:MAG: endonuclease I [Marinilabiliales bacterium]|nr:MAG: endonuclease I [Marinilabiliales bacterium]